MPFICPCYSCLIILKLRPNSSLPTLSSYLTETHTIIPLILQVPPIDPSTSLRTTLLLRLTGEVMTSALTYKPKTETLSQLLDWLNDLDKAWLTVLRSQVWDPEEGVGRDIVTPDGDVDTDPMIHSTLMSQTERTRLRSLLVTGAARLEEWLELFLVPEGEDYNDVLERLGLRQGFDKLFYESVKAIDMLDDAEGKS